MAGHTTSHAGERSGTSGYAVGVIELLLQADRLLTVGLTDQADAIYRRVAAQDPRNAIAVVGMARCALARADDHEAYRLASRALAIDPEDEMARRMEARMREVLETRGEVPGAGEAAHSAGTAAPSADAGTATNGAAAASAVVAPHAPSTAAEPPAPVPPPIAPAAIPAAPPAATSTMAPDAPPAPARRSLLDRIRGRGR